MGALRAFGGTLRTSLVGPIKMGRRLGGAGHMAHSLQYVFLCGVCGLLPLSIAGAVPLLTWADAPRLGLPVRACWGRPFRCCQRRSCSPLCSHCASPWGRPGCGVCAGCGESACAYDVVTRAAAYGLSPLALPVIGPLLLPLGLFWSGLALYGAIGARGGSARAIGSLALSSLAWVLVGLVAFWCW